jgi:hypothetical protein
MKYTTDRPVVDGNYWAKFTSPRTGTTYQTIVFVRFWGRSAAPEGITNCAYVDGEAYPLSDACFKAFAGPIPFPEE